MTVTVPISELKQKTGQVLNTAVTRRQDIIVERYGEEYAVIVSRERYQELLDAARLRVRERFLEARSEVYRATADIPVEEIDTLVEDLVAESRRNRAGGDEGNT